MQNEWTEKYRPKSLSQIVGNDNAVRVLRRWADSWRSGAPRFKAIVLRGEPGIGKTSAALALANDMGWDLIEMNASDHRNAASIKKVAGMGAVSQTFTQAGEYLTSGKGRRKLIVLDEADNLFGREDYGGAKAIVETIKESSQPIILIVNDYRELSRKSPAIKSLAEKAFFNRLDAGSIITVLRSIADKEGTRVQNDVLKKIAENCAGDARAAINDLQMMVEGKEEITVKDSDAMGKRNQLKELDSALDSMFGARTLREARDATFDIDKTPDELEKWIEEAIPQEMRDPADLARAFVALARSDEYLGMTRRLQHYGLWSYAKEMMTGGVALSRKQGARIPVREYGFPSHFIMLSRAKGPRAARDSIAGKLAQHLHTSKRCVIDSTLPLLAVTVRNDRQLLLKLVSEFGLDEGDVALLLEKETDSPEVRGVMSEAQGPSAGEEAKPARAGKPKPARGEGRFSGF